MSVLRLPANIERSWMDLQDALFRRCGLDSTRLFPPLIPLVPLGDLIAGDPDDTARKKTLTHTLEGFRKKHTLEIVPDTPSPENPRKLPEPDATLPPGVPLEIAGFAELRSALSREFPKRARKDESLLERSFRCPASSLLCSWEPLEETSPLAQSLILHHHQEQLLPRTRAFWLSAIEILPGPDQRHWWRGALWKEIFCRRTTVKPEPPPPRGGTAPVPPYPDRP
ncbi:hypothetical protein [Alkalispirochaeta americana]|nr:hypothetical protein [Alkalispirochaeta americana]